MSRATGVALSVVVGALAGTACSDVDQAAEYRELADQSAQARIVFQAVPVTADDAYRVVVSDGSTDVEVLHSDTAVWQAGDGATDVGVAMMEEAEAVLLPTLAYRRLDVDADDAQFGLVGSELAMTVETRTARRFHLTIGGSTPNGGGYYARVDSDPSVYVVIPQVPDYIRSILVGDRIVRPMSDEYARALAAVDETGEAEAVTNPWLAQVLAEAPGGTDIESEAP
jgi:hypothetical protein